MIRAKSIQQEIAEEAETGQAKPNAEPGRQKGAQLVSGTDEKAIGPGTAQQPARLSGRPFGARAANSWNFSLNATSTKKSLTN